MYSCCLFEDDSEASLSGVENKGMKVTADQPISVQISIPSGSQGENLLPWLFFFVYVGLILKRGFLIYLGKLITSKVKLSLSGECLSF